MIPGVGGFRNVEWLMRGCGVLFLLVISTGCSGGSLDSVADSQVDVADTLGSEDGVADVLVFETVADVPGSGDSEDSVGASDIAEVDSSDLVIDVALDDFATDVEPDNFPAEVEPEAKGDVLEEVELPCVPVCDGLECGDDGCGGECGLCVGDQDECVAGVCVCVSLCDGLECGDDGCGGECGTCTGLQDLCADGLCICISACDGLECGDDGCGEDCGSCVVPESCTLETGQCECLCDDVPLGPVCDTATLTTYSTECEAVCALVDGATPGPCSEDCPEYCTEDELETGQVCSFSKDVWDSFCDLKCEESSLECSTVDECPAYAHPGECTETCWLEPAEPISVGDKAPHFVCLNHNTSSPLPESLVNEVMLTELVWIAYFGSCG